MRPKYVKINKVDIIKFDFYSSQDCGHPVIPPKPNNGRIINGEEAIPHSFPWMVSIQGSIDPPHYCGASIISPNWILTAAHCGKLVFIGTYSGDEVALGQHDRESQESGRYYKGPQAFKV